VRCSSAQEAGVWGGRTCNVVDIRVYNDVEALLAIVLGNFCGGELLRHVDALDFVLQRGFRVVKK
jgi:hypothetical protein